MKEFVKWLGIGIVVLVICLVVVLAVDYFLPPGWTFGYDVLVALTAVVLSMTFNYMPVLRVQFAALSSEYKQLINLILIVVLSVIMFVFTCTNLFIVPGVECTKEGIKTLLIYIFLAAGGSQLTYKLSPQTSDVKIAKAERDMSSG